MDLITRDPGLVSGTPCFAGTRVPVKTLFDVLEDGKSLDDFIEHFPTVEREQAVAVLELVKQRLSALTPAPAA